MKTRCLTHGCCAVAALVALEFLPPTGLAAEKLLGIHSARTMSQSMPWIAQDVGLLKKNDLVFQLVFISPAALGPPAPLSGDGEVAITGGESILRVLTQGVTEFVFIAS